MAAKRNQIREKPPASNTIDRDTLIWSAAAVVLLGIFVLYLAFPDKVYIFDGIMFSSIIERSTEEWRSQLFNGRHLVFNPFMMYLRDALGAIHLPVRAYPLIQEVNAATGVVLLRVKSIC